MGDAIAAMQQALPEQGEFGAYVKAIWKSRELTQLWVLLGAGAAGMAGHYLFKFLRDDIRGSLWNYLFRDHPKSTALAVLVLAGWAVASVAGGLAQGMGWTALINLGLTTGFAIDALVNKANQAVWTPEERAQRLGRRAERGFVQLQLVGILAAAIAFIGYSALLYHEGGRGPRAELAKFRAEVEAQAKIHAAEDAKKDAQTRTIIQEKDHERETQLANTGRAWADELARVRGERDRLARSGSKPAPIAARVCNGADGNQRLSDALARAEQDTRAAVADYQAGVGELLVVADRQALNWDNLKSAVAGIRALNTTGTP